MASNSISSNPIIIDEIYNATILRHPPVGGGIATLSNTDNNVSVSVNGTNGQINLMNQISINTLSLNDKILLNGSAGSTGQVLTSQGSGAAIWSDNPDTGITGLNNTDGNVSVSVVGSTGTVNLEPNIDITSLTITDFKNPWSSNQPASNGQVLSSDTNGNLSWVDNVDTGITTLNNTDGNVSVSVVGTTGTVNLEPNIDITSLTITDFKNPWSTNQPVSNGQVLSSDTNGNLSWVDNVDTGITALNNTDGNVSVSVVGDTGTVNLENSITVQNVNISGGNINMKGNNIYSAHWLGNNDTDPQTSIDIYTNWNQGANTWGGEIYLDNTGVYLTTVQESNNLIYDNTGNLSNYGTVDAYPPVTTPANWSISSAGNAELNDVNIKNVVKLNNSSGNSGQVLTSQGSNPPIWTSVPSSIYTTIHYSKGFLPANPPTSAIINVYNNTINTFTIGTQCIIYLNCSLFTPSSTIAWYPVIFNLFVDGNSTSEQQVSTPNNNNIHNSYNTTFLFTPTATSHSIAINASPIGGFMLIESDTNDISVLKIDEF